MTAVPESSPSAVDLTPYVPRVVVDWLRTDPEARRRELEGTLAFVDISGFTAMNERLARKGKLGAEEVTEVMNRTFERLLDVAYARCFRQEPRHRPRGRRDVRARAYARRGGASGRAHRRRRLGAGT